MAKIIMNNNKLFYSSMDIWSMNINKSKKNDYDVRNKSQSQNEILRIIEIEKPNG